jgi:signal transduction histidine kinase
VAFTYLVVIVVAFIAINISILEILDGNLLGRRKDVFRLYANWIAQTIVYNFASDDPDVFANVAFDIQNMSEQIYTREQESTRVLVLNENGVVDFDSYNILAGPDSLLRRNLLNDFPEISVLLEGGFVEPRDLYIFHNEERFPSRILYAYAPIHHELHGVIGVVIISTSLSGLQELILDVRNRLTAFSSLVGVVIFIASAVLSGYITRPIRQLTDAIREMGQGKMGQRISIKAGGEIKELGEAFNMMSERLETLDKARNQFVSNASHELRTPLSAIKVLAESLLHSDVRDFSVINEFLTDINDEIDRLSAIINDLLTLVQIDTKGIRLKKEVIDIAEMTKETVYGLRPLAHKKSVELEVICEDGLAAQGDKLKLEQVVSNIVDNAIKYTPEGGRVKVEALKDGSMVLIRVSDTGLGISQDEIPHLFDRFYRVDKARSRITGGTGLGLSIASEIVILHGGRINVTSVENEGSVFSVELPIFSIN